MLCIFWHKCRVLKLKYYVRSIQPSTKYSHDSQLRVSSDLCFFILEGFM